MLELGFADQKLHPISTIRARPHSVIFTHESKPSIFSSASGNLVGRCSFGSDVVDHRSLISQLSKDLVRDIQSTASPGPDQQAKRASVREKSNPFKKKMSREKGCGEEEDDDDDDDDDETTETPPNNSLKECQGTRPEAVPRKHRRRRPASLDLNIRSNVAASSPRFAPMKKTSASSRRAGAFPSPVTPSSCSHGTGDGIRSQKDSNQERLPLPSNCSRRSGNGALLPFNSGRGLPSKWEDAEKWIFSPVAGNGSNRPPPSIGPQERRPMSKSGPLGTASYSTPSSMMPVFDGGMVGNFVGRSPFSAGVLVPDASSGQAFGGGSTGVGYFPVLAEHCMVRSASVNGCSDMQRQSSMLKDEKKKDGTKDASTMISPALSKRDIGTQMSPVHSTNTSPKGKHSCSASSWSILPIAELQCNHLSKLEVKDVQVDDHVTANERSKKHGTQGLDKCSTSVRERKKKVVRVQTSAWEIAETQKCISNVRRDEANILAWENLQKARAEAEIRKLEMKLEKMRTSSMDKIMNKLRLAERKAQEMRNSVAAGHIHEVTMVTTTVKEAASFRKARQKGSLTGCFVCHIF